MSTIEFVQCEVYCGKDKLKTQYFNGPLIPGFHRLSSVIDRCRSKWGDGKLKPVGDPMCVMHSELGMLINARQFDWVAEC